MTKSAWSVAPGFCDGVWLVTNRRRVGTGGRSFGDLNDDHNTGEDIPVIQNSVVF